MASKPQYRIAVGLEYSSAADEDAATPRVHIKGEHRLADRVVALARKHRIPIIEDPALARSLTVVDLDQEIPAALFEAVAVVIHYAEELMRNVNGSARDAGRN